VVHEVARRCPLPINRDTTTAAQAWIVHNQIAEELVAGARYPVVICDRSVLDNYVYLLLADGKQAALDGLIAAWMRSYALLIEVPIVEAPQPDGVRSADPGFQAAVERRLGRELERHGLTPQRLDPADRGGWLDEAERVALHHLRPPQLSLLDPPETVVPESEASDAGSSANG
jgi:hypothetical protein